MIWESWLRIGQLYFPAAGAGTIGIHSAPSGRMEEVPLNFPEIKSGDSAMTCSESVRSLGKVLCIG